MYTWESFFPMDQVAKLRVPYVLLRDRPTFRYVPRVPVLSVSQSDCPTFRYIHCIPVAKSKVFKVLRSAPCQPYIPLQSVYSCSVS